MFTKVISVHSPQYRQNIENSEMKNITAYESNGPIVASSAAVWTLEITVGAKVMFRLVSFCRDGIQALRLQSPRKSFPRQLESSVSLLLYSV